MNDSKKMMIEDIDKRIQEAKNKAVISAQRRTARVKSLRYQIDLEFKKIR